MGDENPQDKLPEQELENVFKKAMELVETHKLQDLVVNLSNDNELSAGKALKEVEKQIGNHNPKLYEAVFAVGLLSAADKGNVAVLSNILAQSGMSVAPLERNPKESVQTIQNVVKTLERSKDGISR